MNQIPSIRKHLHAILMQTRKRYPGPLALLLVLNMLVAGCLGLVDDTIDDVIDEIEQIGLPDDWNDISQRNRSNPNLHGFGSCSELEDTLKDHIAEEMRTQLLQLIDNEWGYYRGGGFGEDDVAMMDGATEGAPSAAGSSTSTNSAQPVREEGKDYSGTNNQEEGVDEADFVKTDGYNIYVLQNTRLFILGVPEFGELTSESNLTIEGQPTAMLLTDGKLVILSTVNVWNVQSTDPLYDILRWDDSHSWWRSNTLTKLTVIDVTNASDAQVERELYIEGYYQTAREVDGTVRMVSHGWVDIPEIKWYIDYPESYWEYEWDDPLRNLIRNETIYQTIQDNMEVIASTPLSKIIPQVYERMGDQVLTHALTSDTCDDFVTSEDSSSRSFTSIFTLNMLDDDFSFEADHLMTNTAQVYASQDVLLIAESANDWWWYWDNDDFMEATNIHSFYIGEAGETTYTGSGRIDGTVRDQFSLSEYNGTIRAATTTGQWGRWWMANPEPMSNHVITMQRDIDSSGIEYLKEVGHVGGIAEGESIWSTRFVGDTCYLVTFRNIDPLWTIDLSDPTDPTILGELEVPGVSTYIHPMSEDYLLTIGLPAANEDGTGLDWSSVQVSQFNVSNLSNPTLLDKLLTSPVSDADDRNSWQWSYSEATYEHKAFQYWQPKGLLAIPMSTYQYVDWQDSTGEYQWSYRYISQLILINTAPGENFSVYGTIDHSDMYNSDEGHYYWSSSSIRRSIFMGDYVYAISPAGVTAHNLTTLEETASVQLWAPEYDYYNHYYEEECDDCAVTDVKADESSGSSDPDDDRSSGSSTGSEGGSSDSEASEDNGETDQ